MIKKSALVLGSLIVLGAVLLVYLGSQAHIVEAHLQQPDTVLVGQAFDVTLLLENTTDNELVLVSMGIEQSLMDNGLQLVEMVPNYRTIETRQRWAEYVYSRLRRPNLAPGDTIPLRLRLIATEPRQYKGEIALWYNNHVRSDYVMLHIDAQLHPIPWLGR